MEIYAAIQKCPIGQSSTKVLTCPEDSQDLPTDFPAPDPQKKPTTELVDYFSYDFDTLDMHTTWAKARRDSTHNPKCVPARRYIVILTYKVFDQTYQRKENLLLRRTFQTRGNLAKLDLKFLPGLKIQLDEGRHYGRIFSRTATYSLFPDAVNSIIDLGAGIGLSNRSAVPRQVCQVAPKKRKPLDVPFDFCFTRVCRHKSKELCLWFKLHAWLQN